MLPVNGACMQTVIQFRLMQKDSQDNRLDFLSLEQRDNKNRVHFSTGVSINKRGRKVGPQQLGCDRNT